MREHNRGTKISFVNSPKTNNKNALELFYNKDLSEYLKVTEFKELKFNKRQEYTKAEDSDINILYIEDLDLHDMLKGKEFPEKDFNVENSFLKIEEEEYLNLKNQKDKITTDDNNNIKFKKNKNKIIENDVDDSTFNQLNNRLFYDEEFKPGLFTSFDFKDKIKSIINSSLNIHQNNNNTNLNLFNKMSDKNSTDSIFDKEELKTNIDDSFILDTCLGDKDITYDNIIVNFDEEAKSEKKEESVSDDRMLDFEYFKKAEAIPEYENQIILYQYLNQIEKQKSIHIYPEEDEIFDKDMLEYFIKLSKEINDEGIKNKVKLLLKVIMYKDKKTQKSIFTNKMKNDLLKYWKNKYEKELDEATFKEKSKILQQKFDNVSQNNKTLENIKKPNDIKKKTNLRKHGNSYYRGNNLHRSISSKTNTRINTKSTSPMKNTRRSSKYSIK